MSRKGNCWDNACAESFFRSLRVEALQDEPIMDRDNMSRAVFVITTRQEGIVLLAISAQRTLN